MKYVIIHEQREYGPDRYHLATFSETIIHRAIAEAMQLSLPMECTKVHSAGFFHTTNGVVHCNGFSESLNVGAKYSDADIISDHLGNIDNLDSENIRAYRELKEELKKSNDHTH